MLHLKGVQRAAQTCSSRCILPRLLSAIPATAPHRDALSVQSSPRHMHLARRPAMERLRAIPNIPREWEPPSDPSRPQAPPEFTPPSDPVPSPGQAPEFVPPEQRPMEEPRRGDPPMRPLPPEEEPQVPDPERDPLRTPERRREIAEPEPEPMFSPEEE